MTTGFSLALAAAAVLALSAPAWSAGKAPPPAAAASVSAKTGIAEARKLMRTGKFDEALTILTPLVKARAVHADAVFNYGLAAIGASQAKGVSEERKEALLDAAIAAFHTMLVRRPELVRVRLELARAFFLKGEDTLARRHFEQVLAGKPPAAVALNVGRFLAQIRARKRWSVRVGAALAPDSNIGSGSDERFIYIDVGGQRLPFRRNQEELTSSGIGVSVWGGGEYQYPLDERWRLRAGGNFSRREYRSDEFDRMVVSAHLGPRWLIGRAREASLMASARQSWLSDEEDYRDLGIRTEFRQRLTRQTRATLRASRHERRYAERDRLDGPITDVSVSASHGFSPTLRGSLAAGWGRERPETERFRNERRWVRTGLTVALPWGFTVGGAATLRWADYEGNWFPFTGRGEARSDLVRNLRFNVHNRAVTVAGFSPRLSFVTEHRTSNAQLHDYERIFGELSFVRLF